jgi:hypothetical protein
MSGKDVKQWGTAVNDEHGRMVKHSIWQAILKRDILKAAKIINLLQPG